MKNKNGFRIIREDLGNYNLETSECMDCLIRYKAVKNEKVRFTFDKYSMHGVKFTVYAGEPEEGEMIGKVEHEGVAISINSFNFSFMLIKEELRDANDEKLLEFVANLLSSPLGSKEFE